jgi:predicted membrane channel-forming protein YqfA (hemolysin III family)
MSIGASIFLLVVGAILTFAVDVKNTGGINLDTVGIILMVAGVVGLLLSLLFWSSFSPYRRRSVGTYPEERVVEERRIERDYP